MQFNSPFIPGGTAYLFNGQILPLKVVSIEFIDPAACGASGPDPIIGVHVAMPDGSVPIMYENQGLYPSLESVLESLLPEGARGLKVSLSGDPAPVAQAPAPAQEAAAAPAARKGSPKKPAEPPVRVAPEPAEPDPFQGGQSFDEADKNLF